MCPCDGDGWPGDFGGQDILHTTNRTCLKIKQGARSPGLLSRRCIQGVPGISLTIVALDTQSPVFAERPFQVVPSRSCFHAQAEDKCASLSSFAVPQFADVDKFSQSTAKAVGPYQCVWEVICYGAEAGLGWSFSSTQDFCFSAHILMWEKCHWMDSSTSCSCGWIRQHHLHCTRTYCSWRIEFRSPFRFRLCSSA